MLEGVNMQNADILKVIKERQSTMSKGHRAIAAYIIDHYDTAAFITASKLGDMVGVSESTVVRFACALGFDGYPELQKKLQELGLFVTAMNLLPVGQLDGGHIFYTMFGYHKHKMVARIIFVLLLFFGLLGFLPIFDIFLPIGWSGWFIWALLLFFIVKLEHPPVEVFLPLDNRRKALGWISIIIFFLSFSLTPFSL